MARPGSVDETSKMFRWSERTREACFEARHRTGVGGELVVPYWWSEPQKPRHRKTELELVLLVVVGSCVGSKNQHTLTLWPTLGQSADSLEAASEAVETSEWLQEPQ